VNEHQRIVWLIGWTDKKLCQIEEGRGARGIIVGTIADLAIKNAQMIIMGGNDDHLVKSGGRYKYDDIHANNSWKNDSFTFLNLPNFSFSSMK